MGDEIKAMTDIRKAMEDLEDDEARRVLRWAVDKFGGEDLVRELGTSEAEEALNGGDGGPEFERLADLIDAANPTTAPEYVLVTSYWFQQLQGAENVTGLQVNNELKDLGHGASNITEAFSSLIERTPRLARQVQKTGTSRQARKRYRLTGEGIRHVERMLTATVDE